MDKVNHFEIPVEDLEKGQHFYSHIFGWEMREVPMEDAKDKYLMALTNESDKRGMSMEPGAINGALMLRDETGFSPVIVISVDSMENSVKMIEDHGGELVMEPQEIGDMGWYARFKDPDGNIVGLWQDMKKD